MCLLALGFPLKEPRSWIRVPDFGRNTGPGATEGDTAPRRGNVSNTYSSNPRTQKLPPTRSYDSKLGVRRWTAGQSEKKRCARTSMGPKRSTRARERGAIEQPKAHYHPIPAKEAMQTAPVARGQSDNLSDLLPARRRCLHPTAPPGDEVPRPGLVPAPLYRLPNNVSLHNRHGRHTGGLLASRDM